LRSSFISYFYAAGNSDEADNGQVARESVAKVMRHSVREAEKTYDRRTVLEKKRKGMEVLAATSRDYHHK
jgi:hypothetical protein